MTRLFRVNTAINGQAGGPGIATMFFLDVATAVDSVHELWTSFLTIMPDDCQIQVQGFGDVIESTSGALVDSWTGVEPVNITGGSNQVYAAPVGVLARWTTDTIVDGHRLRGRTFIVPASSIAFDAAGQVLASAIAGVQSAMIAFQIAQSSSFVVWHRPKFGPKPAGGGERPLIRAGSHGLVTGTGISRKAVVLRSRRD